MCLVASFAVGCDFNVAALAPSESRDLGDADLSANAGDDLATPGADDLSGESADLTGVASADLKGPPADLTAAPADLTAAPADLLSTDLATVTGVLSGTRAGIGGMIDLTAEGTTDWVHWGRLVAGDVNRKSTTVKGIAMTNTGTLVRWPSFSPQYKWSDGTPTVSESGTNAGVYILGDNNAYTFTVPAGTTTRTLRLYLTIYRGTGVLTAHLSDASAADYTDSQTNGIGNTNSRYTISFRSAKADQTLTVTYTLTNDQGGGTVDLMAATWY